MKIIDTIYELAGCTIWIAGIKEKEYLLEQIGNSAMKHVFKLIFCETYDYQDKDTLSTKLKSFAESQHMKTILDDVRGTDLFTAVESFKEGENDSMRWIAYYSASKILFKIEWQSCLIKLVSLKKSRLFQLLNGTQGIKILFQY